MIFWISSSALCCSFSLISLSFNNALILSFASRRTLRTATLPCSPSPFTILIKSRRRSSVNGGSGTRIVVPAEDGFKPKSEVKIAFSTAEIKERSKTVTAKVRASSATTFANWRSGVAAP